MEKIEQLQQMLDQSRHVVFFGGAGVSTESGIPDFRSTDGLYHQKYPYPPETMLSHTFYQQHPEEFFTFYRDKMLYPNAKPNAAHKKLAELEQAGKLTAVVTQNIDGLHQAAGSKKVLSCMAVYCVTTVRAAGSFIRWKRFCTAAVSRAVPAAELLSRMLCCMKKGLIKMLWKVPCGQLPLQICLSLRGLRWSFIQRQGLSDTTEGIGWSLLINPRLPQILLQRWCCMNRWAKCFLNCMFKNKNCSACVRVTQQGSLLYSLISF